MLELIGVHLPTLSEWIELLGGFYAGWGYPLVLAAAALENTLLVTFFFPGGTMVLLGGVYARLGTLELPWVILVGWIGTYLGASFDYWVGRLGERGPFARVLGRRELRSPLARAGALLARYGMLALLGGHFVSQIRSLVAVAAGITRLPYRRFALYEAPAALAWATVYGVGGYLLADQLPRFEAMMNRFGWVAALISAALLAWRFWRPLRPAEAEGDSACDDRQRRPQRLS
ncbi:MAG TPA: DedA family protein [Chloroflexota bacterium]|jgi:membrane protein DedA with SNARE-associated domain|nr:DedA family protein [Chloroflexota bacterium]